MFPCALRGEAGDCAVKFQALVNQVVQEGKAPVVSLFTGVAGLDLAFSKWLAQIESHVKCLAREV